MFRAPMDATTAWHAILAWATSDPLWTSATALLAALLTAVATARLWRRPKSVAPAQERAPIEVEPVAAPPEIAIPSEAVPELEAPVVPEAAPALEAAPAPEP